VLFPPFGRLKGFPIGGKSTRRAMPVKRCSGLRAVPRLGRLGLGIKNSSAADWLSPLRRPQHLGLLPVVGPIEDRGGEESLPCPPCTRRTGLGSSM